jgi:UDP-GlcNAc:undecaprenyl-phosphate GlcNAc-1-phosphate transferase
MIDGVDGLATGMALISCVFLLLAGAGNEVALTCFAAALLAFACFNFPMLGRPAAQAFLGDAGSMLIGLWMAWMLIHLGQASRQATIEPIVAVYCMALPLMDTLGLILRRLLAGGSPLSSDRRHLHYLLMGLGLTPRSVTYTMLALQVGFALIAVTVQVPAYLLFYPFIGLVLVTAWFGEVRYRKDLHQTKPMNLEVGTDAVRIKARSP